MSYDPMGSRDRSLRYWAQTPQDEHICLIAACIANQYTDYVLVVYYHLRLGELCVSSVTFQVARMWVR